ncbi:MAG: M50 family metallopeptidase [Candidatus Pacebacteria bacterium]|nr:M50 family metallopeptidase [Candidatus Paceibacterota bacterium]
MFILDIIIFLFILGIVVLIHELGHFWAAKLTGTRVDEFSIGFPPRIWQKKKGDTNYTIGAIPLGGYNKIYGMDSEDENSGSDPHSYNVKGPWEKALICVAGVVMNVIFASLVFYIVMFAYNFKAYMPMIMDNYSFKFGHQEQRVLVSYVGENTPAAKAGVKPHDILLSANGKDVYAFSDASNVMNENTGKEVTIKFLDWASKKEVEAKVIPEVTKDSNGKGIMGIGMSEISIIDYSSDAAISGFLHAYNYMDYSLSAMGYMFNKSIAEKSTEPLANSMAGPVGIFAVTKIIVQNGLIEVINLVAVLSLALGLTNLLPIPALDGAKLIFIALESINKKIFNKNIQDKIEMGGFAFLILLAIVLLFKDIIQFKDIIFKL